MPVATVEPGQETVPNGLPPDPPSCDVTWTAPVGTPLPLSAWHARLSACIHAPPRPPKPMTTSPAAQLRLALTDTPLAVVSAGAEVTAPVARAIVPRVGSTELTRAVHRAET